ncbi:MAG: DUF5996 family protein [Spirochaetales bacterium]|nr:DUF5996 family protein [Spirochaetales bacterium]
MAQSDLERRLFRVFDYQSGRESIRTLHLLLQMVGKVRLASVSPRRNFQHVTLFVDTRGFTTRPIRYRGGAFEIVLNAVEYAVHVSTSDGRSEVVALQPVVADFYRSFSRALDTLGIDVSIKPEPYDVPGESTPFGADTARRELDPATLRAIWRTYLGVSSVLEEFAFEFTGAVTSPQFYWHHIDISSYRFGPRTGARDLGTQQISSGFWIGDEQVGEPMVFSYLYPAPEEPINDSRLDALGTVWAANRTAMARYNELVTADDPYAACLSFYRATYEAFMASGGW